MALEVIMGEISLNEAEEKPMLPVKLHTDRQFELLKKFASADNNENNFNLYDTLFAWKRYTKISNDYSKYFKQAIIAMYAMINKIFTIFGTVDIASYANPNLLYYCCYILAHKFLEDESYDLGSFRVSAKKTSIYEISESGTVIIRRNPITQKRLAELEIALFEILDFNVTIHPHEMEKMEQWEKNGYIVIERELYE